jgi:hypothetical protein
MFTVFTYMVAQPISVVRSYVCDIYNIQFLTNFFITFMA